MEDPEPAKMGYWQRKRALMKVTGKTKHPVTKGIFLASGIENYISFDSEVGNSYYSILKLYIEWMFCKQPQSIITGGSENYHATIEFCGNKYWGAVATNKKTAKKAAAKETLNKMFPVREDDPVETDEELDKFIAEQKEKAEKEKKHGKVPEESSEKNAQENIEKNTDVTATDSKEKLRKELGFRGKQDIEDNDLIVISDSSSDEEGDENTKTTKDSSNLPRHLKKLESGLFRDFVKIAKRMVRYHKENDATIVPENLTDDEMNGALARNGLSLEGTKEELIERLQTSLDEKNIHIPTLGATKLKEVYDLTMSLRKMLIKQFNYEMFKNENVLEYLKDSQGFQLKTKPNGEIVAEITFSTTDQSDSAVSELKELGFDVEHPKHSKRPTQEEDASEERGEEIEEPSEPNPGQTVHFPKWFNVDFWKHFILVEEISKDLNHEEKLNYFFQDALNIVCLNNPNHDVGFALLEFPSIEALNKFFANTGRKATIDGETVKLFKYVNRSVQWLKFSIRGRYENRKDKKALSDEERIAVNTEIIEKVKQGENLPNSAEFFGQEKIKEYLRLNERLLFLRRKLNVDTELRLRKGDFTMPEGEDVLASTQSRIALKPRQPQNAKKKKDASKSSAEIDQTVFQDLMKLDKEHVALVKKLEQLVSDIKVKNGNLTLEGQKKRVSTDNVSILITKDTPNYVTKLLSQKCVLVSKKALEMCNVDIHKYELPFRKPIKTGVSEEDEEENTYDPKKESPKPKKCKFFASNNWAGVCPRGDRCTLSHQRPRPVKIVWVQKKHSERKDNESMEDRDAENSDDEEAATSPKLKKDRLIPLNSDDYSPIICKYFKKLGKCSFGPNCKYLHDEEIDVEAIASGDPKEKENFGKKDVREPVVTDKNICRHYSRGMCERGTSCQFLHSASGKDGAPRVCSYYARGHCEHGDNCKFPHIKDASSTAPRVCSYFARGHCEHGDKCKFPHIKDSPITPRVCSYFARGHCEHGDKCKFPHIKGDDKPSISGPTVCKHFLKGTCERGSACSFLHDDNHRQVDGKCRFFMQGHCEVGDRCKFIHDVRSKGVITPSSGTLMPCKHFQTGHCKKGDTCNFSHGDANQRKYDPTKDPYACKHFMAGRVCDAGDNCRFVHGERSSGVHGYGHEARPQKRSGDGRDYYDRGDPPPAKMGRGAPVTSDMLAGLTHVLTDKIEKLENIQKVTIETQARLMQASGPPGMPAPVLYNQSPMSGAGTPWGIESDRGPSGPPLQSAGTPWSLESQRGPTGPPLPSAGTPWGLESQRGPPGLSRMGSDRGGLSPNGNYPYQPPQDRWMSERDQYQPRTYDYRGEYNSESDRAASYGMRGDSRERNYPRDIYRGDPKPPIAYSSPYD